MLTRRNILQSLVTVGAVAGIGLPATILAAQKTWQQTRLFMGTVVNITVAQAGRQQADDAMGAAFVRGSELETLFSRHDGNSPVSVLNAQGSLADCPAAWQPVMDAASHIHAQSRGAFDITVVPLLHLMAQSCGQADRADVQEALNLVGQGGLKRDGKGWRFERQGMGLTLDGIAKGHIAQQMSDVLTAQGCGNHMVNAGGDIVARGTADDGRPWRVGIADPTHRGRHVRAMQIPAQGGAVATSGTSEFRYDSTGRSNHLFFPQTGTSSPFASVTVQAPTGLEADALATACSVMPAGEAMRLVAGLGAGYGCHILMRDGRIFGA